MIRLKLLLIVIKMDCNKCIYFESLPNDEYTCKYLKNEEVSYAGDSVQTAEMCEYYKENDRQRK